MKLLILCLIAAVHPSLEIGTPSECQILTNDNYTIGYSSTLKSPVWAAEKLTVNPKNPGRDGNFDTDRRVKNPTGLWDYIGCGYDKGHLAPAGDFANNKDTFLYTNCCPQNPAMNRGLWAHLEEATRKRIVNGVTLYVFTGPLWCPDDPEHEETETENVTLIKYIGRDKIPVPTYFYKVIYTKSEGGGYKAVGYLVPNKKPKKFTLEDYIVPIDLIEHWSGCDFGSLIEENLQKVIERGDE